MSMSGFKKRGFLALLAAAVLFLLIFLASCASGSKEMEVPPVTESSFSLNGADYPPVPLLQDFIDRGWKQGKSVEVTGNYTEEDGPTNLIPTGYRLTSGKYEIDAYLDVDDCRSGTKPGACRLRSLSLYGYDVESFCLDGNELAGIDRERILTVLGSPDSADEREYGVIYGYSLPEKRISEISFAFPNSLDTVAQIFVVFDLAASGE